MIDKKNLAVVRQTFAQAVFTHKIQEVAAEYKGKRASYFKYVHLVLVSSVLVLLAIQASHLDKPVFSYVGIAVSAAEIVFLITQLSFNLEGQAALHKGTALKFMALRDRYTVLIADMLGEYIKRPEIIARRDALLNEYQNICDQAPQTGPKEYTEAQSRLNKRGVVESEQFTWSDEEIDRFLPRELRIKNQK
jgi:hypothetical protein